jgi:hypothetical protein
VKDKQALRQILATQALCAYTDNVQHLRLLHDEGATQQAILNSLELLKPQAITDPGVTVVLYYSRHG